MNGNLVIRLINAKLLHDTEFIGKMSPYVKILAGGEVLKSPVCHRGHLNPTWDWEIMVPLNETLNFIIFEVYSKETFSKDDLIGSAQFPLNQLYQNKFRGWIPLVYNGGDAGALFTDMRCDTLSTTFNQPQMSSNLSEGFIKHTPIFATGQVEGFSSGGGSTMASTMVSSTVTNMPLEPIVHQQETLVYQEEPIIYREKPVVHEKTIITEKPIIHEKQIVYCEQPIIVEKPELHERTLYQRDAPIVTRDQPRYVKEDLRTSFENADLYGAPIIQKETEFRREAPVYTREQPELFEKQIITERPIIHEKDIIHVEKPVIVEKDEFREKPIQMTNAPILEQRNPILFSEVSNNMGDIGENPIVHSETEVLRTAPIVQKERPEIYETKVIHEKPIIHEQPVIFTEQTVIQEKPEIHEKKIFHQEPPKVIQEETIIHQESGVRPPSFEKRINEKKLK
jgi:hypothetical protein